jgi:serine protease
MNKTNILLILALLPALLPGLLRAQGRAVTQPAGSPIALATAPPHDSAASPINARAWELIGLRQAAHFASFRHPVKVAIIDDGFDLDNPLWAGSIAHNSGEIPGNGIDDDHNGKVDDYEGWDFGDNDEDVRPAKAVVDKESHGTRVLGVFWQVLQELSAGAPAGISILPIKAVSDARMNNYVKEGYKGIEYAIQQKADIIVCSWSGPLIAPEEKALLAKARARGIIIIASAGNFYAMAPMYPGAFPSVIDVAATDDAGHKLHVSNYGSFVDICAPGDSLITYNPYSRRPNAWLSATSASTPVVAAIITAIRAAWPALSPAAIERLLKSTATPLDSANLLYAGNLGAGLVNVAALRDVLSGNTASPRPVASPALAATTAENISRQVQGYIDLNHLQLSIPVKIIPYGRYPGIKFLLQSPETATATAALTAALPGVRMTLFHNGGSTDTLVRKDKLRYPFIAVADSIYIYKASAGPLQRPHVSSGAAAGDVWWSYSVMTIDSSNLYCGGTVDVTADAEGILEDGSGDANYSGRNDCKWQFTAPAGKKIKINFEQFDTEPKIDQVYIFNGNSTKDPILAIFSGHKIPPPITSWSNSVLIWFITSEENNFQGWRLHYKVVD